MHVSRLKLTRLEKGLTQWEVWERTGISQTILSLYERGLKQVKREHRKVLSRLYGRKVEELWD